MCFFIRLVCIFGVLIHGCSSLNDNLGDRKLFDIAKEAFVKGCPIVTSADLQSEVYFLESVRYGGADDATLRQYLNINNDSFIDIRMAFLPLSLDFQMFFNRVIEINDIEKTLSAYIELNLLWKLPCRVGINFKKAIGVTPAQKITFAFNKTQVWYPRLVHENSPGDPNSISDRFIQTVYYHVTTTDDALLPGADFDDETVQSVYGSADNAGWLKTSCDGFSFKTFPFDKLECSFVFKANSGGNLLYNFSTPFLSISNPDDVIDADDVWTYVGKSATIENEGMYIELITITLEFERRPGYFVGPIFLPLLLLTVTQIFALCIEPDEPDR